MPRYFLEVSYKGSGYSGFQVQQNANTIQTEVGKALATLQKTSLILTSSSRTDAGVHALQNYFHFDYEEEISKTFVYKMNAILPEDIAVKSIRKVNPGAHCRFDAISREYKYYIYRYKNPFLKDRAYYFPYKIDRQQMVLAADLIKKYKDFTCFSKRKTQVKNFECFIIESEWMDEAGCLVYHVKANRFLRGMVRALTATMLMIGRNKISLYEFEQMVISKDRSKANFAIPACGLFLVSVNYPEGYFSVVE